ncbi:hypothetical protein FQA39_LY11819 [Lamprigera yunnana]|nr:hypothetical protein FQA39_LY11819 [Lamprigera yunnana]
MASSYQQFKELNLNRDEVERLTEALKNQNFRKLLTDYVDEVRDPENIKLYQSEITQLEKERGIDVTFINPVAGYVIKTSINGTQKAFVNICANENVSKPTSTVAVQDGAQGRHWTVPHTLSPPRHDYDKKMLKCQVFDVVFHPETLRLAHTFKPFREMVNKTACDAIETNFDVTIDRKNLKFPKVQFKGMPHASVIRKPSKEPPPELTPDEKSIMDEFYNKAGADYPKSSKKTRKSQKKNKHVEDLDNLYTTPKYVIKHCRHIEMEEFTENKAAKMNTATPKELVVEIDLPLLRSSTDIILDVTEKTLQLTSEKPAKYHLSITLPYRVNHDCGNAKFVKDQKKLLVTLPVILKHSTFVPDTWKDDSGVESDPGSIIPSSPDDYECKIDIVDKIKEVTPTLTFESISVDNGNFLESKLCYSIPEFTTTLYNNMLSFTVNVKNVNNASVEKALNKEESSVHLKFSSISSGFYPTHYALYIKFPYHKIKVVNIETWDNNVVVQIIFKPNNVPLHLYYYGIDADNLSENYLSEATLITESEVTAGISNCNQEKVKNKPTSQTTHPISIVRSLSESSGDEISCSYSPSKSKGILKAFRKLRRFGRSISESGIDDVNWASSLENFYASIDSIIPEEEEISSSLKKTVRFSDVVSRQLFKSNSCILGQKKKKKHWRTKAKKRARNRHHSEGEVIDVVQCDERDCKTTEGSNNEIFQLEIN